MGVIFLNDKTALVGQEHTKKLDLSEGNLKKIQEIVKTFGAWSEGNRSDEKFTRGQIDFYRGSWDDLFANSVTGYPHYFIYTIFSNIQENKMIDKIGIREKETIFNRILASQKEHNFFPRRRYTAPILTKFLQDTSDSRYDFLQMSNLDANKKNLSKFLEEGESRMWPSNWESYPFAAGKVAKKANDMRDKFLISRKSGVYVVGFGHLTNIEKISKNKIEK